MTDGPTGTTPEAQRPTNPITRVGDGRLHFDTIAVSEPRYVLVDGPLDPSDTVVFVESIPVAGPASSPGGGSPPPQQNTSTRETNPRTLDPYHLEHVADDTRVYYWTFWQTSDSSVMSLTLQRGTSKLALFEGVSATALAQDEANAPKSRTVRVGALLRYTIPAWKPPQDPVLAGKRLDYGRVEIERIRLD